MQGTCIHTYCFVLRKVTRPEILLFQALFYIVNDTKAHPQLPLRSLLRHQRSLSRRRNHHRHKRP